MPTELQEAEIENLEQLVSQIADLAGSQGLGEIEQLTEAALAILEGAKVRTSTTVKQVAQAHIPEQTEMG